MMEIRLSVLLVVGLVLAPASGVGAWAQGRNASALGMSITGRVLEENGQPPRDLLQVNLVCNGRLRQQVLTAADGTFAFDLNSSNDEAWLDPASGGSAAGAMEGSAKVASGRSANLDEVPSMGRGRTSLVGCEVQVAPRTGLASEAVSLRTRGSLDNPDIGVLVVRRLSNAAATLVSLKSLNAPRKAREAFEKGHTALTAEKPDLGKAVKELQKAVKEYPEYSEAWDLLARAHLSRGAVEEGRQCFQRAMQAEPGLLSPYLGIAQIAVQAAAWPEVREWTAKALELEANVPEALYWHGLAGYYLADFGSASESLSRLYAQGQAERFPFGLLPLGVIHANQGKIQAAASELNRYLALMPPEQVPDSQRSELQRQIDAWVAEGLAVIPGEAPVP